MRPLFLAAILTSALALPVLAEGDKGRPARCLLVVKGAEIIRGTCLFTPIDADGSFQIAAMNGKFFAQMLVDQPGIGSGYWNETPFSGHAHSPLGTLRREDACWVNEEASICAW